jgi:RNA polymerase Rpb5, N-terminal domain
MTDERVLYRVRKTILEMLKDRRYNVAEAELEESYEEFEKRYLHKPSLNFVATRPCEWSANAGEVDSKMEVDN